MGSVEDLVCSLNWNNSRLNQDDVSPITLTRLSNPFQSYHGSKRLQEVIEAIRINEEKNGDPGPEFSLDDLPYCKYDPLPVAIKEEAAILVDTKNASETFCDDDFELETELQPVSHVEFKTEGDTMTIDDQDDITEVPGDIIVEIKKKVLIIPLVRCDLQNQSIPPKVSSQEKSFTWSSARKFEDYMKHRRLTNMIPVVPDEAFLARGSFVLVAANKKG